MVSFGQPSVVAEDASASEATPAASRVDGIMMIREFEYIMGPLNGVFSRESVTFRPNIHYFRWEREWHVIPEKYLELSEKERNRRMKIKLRNVGKVPWNLGHRWSPGEQREVLVLIEK